MREMKFSMRKAGTALLSAFFVLPSLAQSPGNVTLELNKVSLVQALQQLKSQTQVRFVYSDEELRTAPLVTLSVDDASLAATLDLLFRDQPYTYEKSGENVYVIKPLKPAENQRGGVNKTIRGKVVDSRTGIPLIGATVQEPKSKKRTVSRADGTFTLEVPRDCQYLSVSFMGYKSERMAVKGNSVLVAALQSTDQNRGELRKGFVAGQVIDELGETVIGATVMVKGTQKGVATDVNGHFRINDVRVYGDEKVTLLISYIGKKDMEEGVRLNSESTFTLREDTRMISEVVVTGYQDIKKEQMTGSVTTIRADKIAERYTPSIVNNLEGRVAGLSTYGGKMTIRGTSSLYAETSPLLVVDGLPIEGDIDDLNPYDIESVNVLKDAAATAIYGARASNGIIVITTKNAKKEGKMEIDFSANLTVYEKRNMDYSDNFYMTPEQQVNVEADYWDYYFFNNDGEVKNPVENAWSGINAGTSYVSPIQWAYYRWAKGEISESEVNATLESLKKNNFAKEYGDNILRQQLLQQYNLSLRSRSDKFQSNLTLNYKYDNSGQINSGQSSFNVNYKGVYDVAPWLTATFSVNGIFDKTREAGYDYNSRHTDPWAVPAYERMYNEDGSANLFYYWYDGNPYWDKKGEEGIHDLGVNVKDEFFNNTQTTRRQHMRYHGDLLFKVFKGLTINTQFIYETEHSTVDWYANEQSHLARSIRNAYTTLGSDGKLQYLTPQNGGMRRTTNTDGRFWTARGQVNYSNTFGKHAITALAGIEFRETKVNGSKALMLGYDEQLQNSATHTVDFGTLSQMQYSPYFMANAGGYPANQFVFSPYFEDGMGPVIEEFHRYASGYANLTYTYDEKYNVFASFRKDYADVYGLNAKFRGKPLWSVGAGWNMHNEAFMSAVEWVNFLKLRVSYGVTGNIYQGATSYMTATSTGVNQYTNLPYGSVESPANPNLKWEQSRTTNVGIDFSLLNNRLQGSLDYYNKVGKDIFSNRQLDPTTGFTSMAYNVASMKNRGVELALSYDWLVNNRREDFGWSTSFTFSHNKNTVTSVENPASVAYELISTPYKTGYPSSAMWSYRFAGISDVEGEKGQTLWYIEDGGKAHSASGRSIDILEYSGQSEPKVVMGMDNRFTWNGFSLSVLMAYYGGHKMRALIEDETFDVPTTAISSYFLNAWTPERPTNTPGIGRYASTSLGSEPSYSDISVRDADFLKIRNIVFGYEFPEKWLRPLGVNRISLRFQIDNPKYLWVKNNVRVDPETLGRRTQTAYIFGLNVNL